jgi:hypothetical protein
VPLGARSSSAASWHSLPVSVLSWPPLIPSTKPLAGVDRRCALRKSTRCRISASGTMVALTPSSVGICSRRFAIQVLTWARSHPPNASRSAGGSGSRQSACGRRPGRPARVRIVGEVLRSVESDDPLRVSARHHHGQFHGGDPGHDRLEGQHGRGLVVAGGRLGGGDRHIGQRTSGGGLPDPRITGLVGQRAGGGPGTAARCRRYCCPVRQGAAFIRSTALCCRAASALSSGPAQCNP